MKLRKLMALMLVLVLLLVACSGANTPTDLGKATVEAFIDGIKNLDQEKVKQNLTMKDAADMVGEFDAEGEDAILAKAMFSKLKATYESGEIAEDVTEGTLNYNVHAPDFASLMGQIIAIGMSGEEPSDADMEDMIKNITFKDVMVPFNLVKEGEKWVIADIEQTLMRIMQMDGLNDLIGPGLDFEEPLDEDGDH